MLKKWKKQPFEEKKKKKKKTCDAGEIQIITFIIFWQHSNSKCEGNYPKILFLPPCHSLLRLDSLLDCHGPLGYLKQKTKYLNVWKDIFPLYISNKGLWHLYKCYHAIIIIQLSQINIVQNPARDFTLNDFIA